MSEKGSLESYFRDFPRPKDCSSSLSFAIHNFDGTFDILKDIWKKNDGTVNPLSLNCEFIYGAIQKKKISKWVCYIVRRQHSGSVVECLTQDGGAAGSSLTNVTVLCP